MGCNGVLCISALFVICDILCLSHAFDTISRTHFISDSENGSLVSSDCNFKLGFFSPRKSRARYVGIWLNKISQRTVVWVANRETPIKNSGGVFRIGGDGNLAVFCGNRTSPVWSTNVSVPTGSSTAKLSVSGNLVLVANGTIIWQSFDYPTDTVLPGMRFGLNRKTGLNHILTSWKSTDDPSPGEFSAGFDSHSIPQFFLYRNSVPLWRSGPWNGRVLNGLQEVESHQNNYSNQINTINTIWESNDNEWYLKYLTQQSAVISIVVLEPRGMLKRQIWHESQKWVNAQVAFQDLCDEYSRCGANTICNEDPLAYCACLPGFEQLYAQDWYPRCEETRKADCGKGNGEECLRLEGVKFPDAGKSTVYRNVSLEECARECLKRCNCTGYANAYVDELGRDCILWHGELRDMRRYKRGQHFYLRVDTVELAADAQKNAKRFQTKTNNTLVFITVPVVVEVLLGALVFYYWWKRNARRKGQKQKQQPTSLSNQKDPTIRSGKNENMELVLFELSTVRAATHHFSSTNKLGQGGFGTVYKGQLPNGQEIAVKRLANDSGQGILEFKNEVLLIGKLQHRNLVRLLGYCMEKEEKILIYEYMHNKSLDHFIFDKSRKLLLDWNTRFNIILGIARGIIYLHQDSILRIIHRDLKVNNILLDRVMEPKISDFGLARTFGGDQTQRSTKRIVGTYGYMSSEYMLGGFFSIKSDVFSFGVILLEIISGKKNRGYFHEDPYSNLIQYTWELWKDGMAMKIVDSCIADSSPPNEIQRCIQVGLLCVQDGLLCVQDNARDRPSMSTVVFMLSNETMLPPPKKSTFVIRKKGSGSSMIERECSINEVTITTFNAR